jgi:hypothetical protein
MVRSLILGLGLNWRDVAWLVVALALRRRGDPSLQLSKHEKANSLFPCLLLWLRDRAARAKHDGRQVKCDK